MNIIELQKHWDEFAKIDPLWAVIACPDKKGNRWQIKVCFADNFPRIEMHFIPKDDIVDLVDKMGAD